ncbi:AbgT family transporter [Brevibacillus choshinensis]|uniref:AbgT family transporter n=1 Tax=Brevibacillus choshinensis TaxID=54911 RepID=UPI002E223C20|nr:AbgT family transporter [Brevibacillus choshinensis]MED4583284.1 AbgT family transporter [Brevibacillus choshinensis]MED4752570.1 AbgT family transporter [Brevibacillus choshinensis]MED4782830.1 AbgT family transporter [Brevibacillus choshinensis]
MSAQPVKTNRHEQQSEGVGLLKWVERVGNKLPNPFMLFLYLIAILMVVTALLSFFHVTAMDPIKNEQVAVKNLLSQEGLQWLLPNIIKNFSGFLPLGSILTLMLGVGLAEKVGLLEAVIRKMSLRVSARYASYLVAFIAFFSHVSSDAAFVIMPPLGALIFLAVGRHPVAGLLAAIAGVGSGFSANILIVTTDVLLSGISSEISKSVDPNVTVSVLDNWFFMSASVILLSAAIGFITDKFVEPKLGVYKGEKGQKLQDLSDIQKKGLRAAGIAALAFIAVILVLILPANGILRDPKLGTIVPSPFISGIVPVILLFFFAVAITYGIRVGMIKKQNDIPALLTDPIKGMAGFIVMVFPLSQFVAMFNWSNMGSFLALSITDVLEKMNMTGAPVFIGLMFLSAFLCMFIASGSAIWSLLAPVFIPMFMALGFHPAFAQIAFRVADSSVIPFAIVSPFIPLFLGFLQEYKKDAKLGTYYSLILPYPIAIFILWTLLLIVWYFVGLPIGPGVYPHM